MNSLIIQFDQFSNSDFADELFNVISMPALESRAPLKKFKIDRKLNIKRIKESGSKAMKVLS